MKAGSAYITYPANEFMPFVRLGPIGKLGALRRNPKDQMLMRVMLWAFAIDMIIVPVLFIKLFLFSGPLPAEAAPVSGAENTRSSAYAVSTPVSLGPAALRLMDRLRNEGFSPKAVTTVYRKSLDARGALIALGGDNVLVFEYPDAAAAQEGAELMARKYGAVSSAAIWKKDVHIYMEDALVIFYLGTREDILDSFAHSASSAIVDQSL